MKIKSDSKANLAKILITGLILIFCTSWFHYLYSIGRVEIIYSYLYYIPIVFAAFFYGIFGGFVVSSFVGLAYSAFVCGSGVSYSPRELFPGIASFILIGLITGLLSSRASKARDALSKKVDDLSTTTDVGLAATSTLDLNEILQSIMEKIVSALDCEVGSIMLLEPKSKILTIKASHGIDKNIIKTTRVKLGERISGWVAQHGQPLLIDDIEGDPRFAKRSVEKYYTKSLLSVPLKNKDKIIGVININNKMTKRVFTQEDLHLLTGIALHISSAIDNARLYQEVNETYVGSIKALVMAIDAKDHYTKNHSERVTEYAVAIARRMGLSEKGVEEIQQAAQLHDLGKISVHDHILNKVEKLTEEDWKEIKQHTVRGAEILKPLLFLNGIIEITELHHEHFDGNGYPYGLKGSKIPIGARIICAADAYDAMISDRPYRKAMGIAEARAELKKCAGTHFDPEVIEAFLEALDTGTAP